MLKDLKKAQKFLAVLIIVALLILIGMLISLILFESKMNDGYTIHGRVISKTEIDELSTVGIFGINGKLGRKKRIILTLDNETKLEVLDEEMNKKIHYNFVYQFIVKDFKAYARRPKYPIIIDFYLLTTETQPNMLVMDDIEKPEIEILSE